MRLKNQAWSSLKTRQKVSLDFPRIKVDLKMSPWI